MKLEFSRQVFEKVLEVSNLIKFPPVEAESFHADERRDGQTEMKLTVAFRNVGNAHKTERKRYIFAMRL